MSDESLARSLVNKLYGTAEIGAMIGTAAFTEPFAGYKGLFNIGRGAEQATEEIDAFRHKYTYSPRSETARGWLESAAPYIEKAGKWIDRKATDLETATGGKIPRELTKGVTQFTFEISPIIAGKGIQIAKKAKARTKHIEDVKSTIGDKGPVQRNIEDLIPWEPTKNKPFRAAKYPTERGEGLLYTGGFKWEVDPKTGKALWKPITMGGREDWLKSPGGYFTNVKQHFDEGYYALGKGGVDTTYGSELPWRKMGGSTSHIIKTDYKNIMPNPNYLGKGGARSFETGVSLHDKKFFKLTNREKRYWNKKHDEAKQIAISKGVPVGKDQSLHQYFYSVHGGLGKRRRDTREVRDAKYKEMHDIRESYIAAGIDGIDFGSSTGAGLAMDGHEIVVFNPKVAESILQKTWAAKVTPEAVEAEWKKLKKENLTVKMPSYDTYKTKALGKERYDDPTRVGLTKYESVEQALKDFNMGPTVGARVPDLDNPTEAGFRLLDDLEKKLADRPIDRSQEINDVRDLKQQMRVRQEMLTGEGGVEFPMEVWKSEGYYDIFFHSNKVVPRRKLRTKPGEGGVIPKVGEGGPPGKRKQQQERIAERNKAIAERNKAIAEQRKRDIGEVIETGYDIDPRTGSAVYHANTSQMIRDDIAGSLYTDQDLVPGFVDFNSLRGIYVKHSKDTQKISDPMKRKLRNAKRNAAFRKISYMDYIRKNASRKYYEIRNPELIISRAVSEGRLTPDFKIREIEHDQIILRRRHLDKTEELNQQTRDIDRRRVIKQREKIEDKLEELKARKHEAWIDNATIEAIIRNRDPFIPIDPSAA